jgi:hypothetical protein
LAILVLPIGIVNSKNIVDVIRLLVLWNPADDICYSSTIESEKDSLIFNPQVPQNSVTNSGHVEGQKTRTRLFPFMDAPSNMAEPTIALPSRVCSVSGAIASCKTLASCAIFRYVYQP